MWQWEHMGGDERNAGHGIACVSIANERTVAKEYY